MYYATFADATVSFIKDKILFALGKLKKRAQK